MNVQIQYTAGCPNARPVLQRMKELAHRRADLTLVTTLVEPDRPVPEGFAGSPTVLVDGCNPFRGEPTASPACALYPPTADEVQAALDPNPR